MLTYYDQILGKERIKRRYVWGAWGFTAGVVTGLVMAYSLAQAF
jgi:hypothetical protein